MLAHLPLISESLNRSNDFSFCDSQMSFHSTPMISIILCLAVLASFGAARIVPPHIEDVSTDTSQWQHLSGTAQWSGLSKRMNYDHGNFDPFEEFSDFFNEHTDKPNAQPSSETASQAHTYGLLADESHAFHSTHQQATWDMSHYHPYSHDPSNIYAQGAYFSHDPYTQPHGQGFSEFHNSHHQSQDQISSGSQDEKRHSKGKRRSEASQAAQSSPSNEEAFRSALYCTDARPMFPTIKTTTEELEVALTFYENDQRALVTRKPEYLNLSPEAKEKMTKKEVEIYDDILQARYPRYPRRMCSFDG